MPGSVAHASFKFLVEIDNRPLGAFTECTLPSLEIETEKIIEGGLNDYVHILPKQMQPGNITLKRGLCKADDMMKWVVMTAQGKWKDALKSVTVVMLGENNSPVMSFHFSNCWATKFQGPALNAGTAAVAVEEVQIAYHAVYIE